MTACEHETRFDLDTEIAIARGALDQGDLRHTVHHLAGVLIEAPESLEAEAMVERLFVAARDPLAIVDIEGGAYVGVVVLRARFLTRMERSSEALELMLQAQRAVPDRELLDVERYCQQPEMFDAVDPDLVAGAIYSLCGSPRAARYVALLEELQRRRPLVGRLAIVFARALRAVGRMDEAIVLVERLTAEDPSYLSYVSLGSAYRDAGRSEDAILAWRKALDHDPSDVAVRLDIGDVSLDLGLFADAQQSYADALEHAPDHEWALPSWLFAKWKATGDREAKERLRAIAAQSAPGSRAGFLATLAFPYLLALGPPGNSIMTMARNVLSEAGSMTRIGVSGLEAPSVIAALVDASRRAGKSPPEISFADIPSPDPRVALPIARVKRTLWSYSLDGFLSRLMTRLGTEARPAVPRPEHAISARVVQLASKPYDLDGWTEASVSVAGKLTERDIDSLLATMVHIPDPVEEVDAWDHRFRVQVAAAFLISQIGDRWEGSARLAALVDLLFGPVDWTTSAAIVATCNLGRTEPDLADRIVDLLLPLIEISGGAIHFANIAEPLAACITWLPGLPPEVDEWVRHVQSG